MLLRFKLMEAMSDGGGDCERVIGLSRKELAGGSISAPFLLRNPD